MPIAFILSQLRMVVAHMEQLYLPVPSCTPPVQKPIIRYHSFLGSPVPVSPRIIAALLSLLAHEGLAGMVCSLPTATLMHHLASQHGGASERGPRDDA